MLSTTTAFRRALLSSMVAASAVMLAACAGEITAPSAATASTRIGTSGFVPTSAAKTLYGVSDGTYVVTFNPSYSQSFALGANRIDIPARSVCKLVGSGYGAAYWNQPCTPETLPVTMTVVIKDAAKADSRVDFFPAMRFNPANQVQLFMYVPNATATDATNWVMKYCNDLNVCADESRSDASLRSNVDRQNNVVFRRIKHFSGYVVAENDSTVVPNGIQ